MPFFALQEWCQILLFFLFIFFFWFWGELWPWHLLDRFTPRVPGFLNLFGWDIFSGTKYFTQKVQKDFFHLWHAVHCHMNNYWLSIPYMHVTPSDSAFPSEWVYVLSSYANVEQTWFVKQMTDQVWPVSGGMFVCHWIALVSTALLWWHHCMLVKLFLGDRFIVHCAAE